MEVYALIGASGTGKSHNAYIVMEQYGIDMMIDDGLLIKDGKKMAGSSAGAGDSVCPGCLQSGRTGRNRTHAEPRRSELRACIHRLGNHQGKYLHQEG